MAPPNAIVLRRLYRSLLKAAKPFTLPSSNAIVFNCMLHRSGIEDPSWQEFLRNRGQATEDDEDFADDFTFPGEDEPYQLLLRKLVRKFITGNEKSGIRQMQLPQQILDQPNMLHKTIQKEFRGTDEDCISNDFDDSVRLEVAFMALRKLNEKLDWIKRLQQSAPSTIAQNQAALGVAPLPFHPPSSYLRPGAFLIAHPHLDGYFRRTVICILDHNETSESGFLGTYGLVVNRACVSPNSGKILTLEEVLHPLPSEMAPSFGGSIVREGGPVHMSLQMVHASSDDEHGGLGGTLLPAIASEDKSTFLKSDRAIYFKGDILRAANGVLQGWLDREDVCFFVGASCWAPGQLESEMERGCWIPFRGPPEIALTGMCEHAPSVRGAPRPKADLWVSMLTACGDEEAKLANLVSHDDGEDRYAIACDEEDL